MAGFLSTALGPVGGPVLVFNAAKVAAAAGVAIGGAGAAAGSVFWTVVGAMLWVIGVYALSQHYRDEGLVDKAVYSGALLAASAFAPLGRLAMRAVQDILAGVDPDNALEALVEDAAVAWLLLLGASYYFKQALEGLSQLSGGQRELARAAGLALPGAALAIVGVGGIILVAAAGLAVAGLLALTPPGQAGGQASR